MVTDPATPEDVARHAARQLARLAAAGVDVDFLVRPARAQALADNEAKIVEELVAVQGNAVDIGGYYKPDMDKLASAMRPSATLNDALATLAG